MRTGLQHFAFRDVVARIRSLEDVSAEAWCSHGPGAGRRFLSSLSCQASVSVKQQLELTQSRAVSVASRHGCWRRQRAAWAALCFTHRPPALPEPPGGGETGGIFRIPDGKTRNTLVFNSDFKPGRWECRSLLDRLSIPSSAAPPALRPRT